MKKLVLLLVLSLSGALAISAELTVFRNGEVANADDVNSNFSALNQELIDLRAELSALSTQSDLARLETQLPRFTLWLDASNVDGQDNATLEIGDSVSSWTSLSGKNSVSQSDPEKRPTLTNAGLKFDGVDDYLWTESTENLTDVTLIAVLKLDTLEAEGSYLGGSPISVQSQDAEIFDAIVFWERAENPYRFAHGTERFLRTYAATQTETDLAPLVIYDEAVSEGFRILRNGTLVGQAGFDPASKPSTRFVVGNRLLAPPAVPVRNGFWKGRVYEIMVVEGALTAKERAIVHGYLALKWGLSIAVDSDSDGIVDANDGQPYAPL